MAQLNGNYLNSTNIAVLGTSAHETSEIQIFNHPKFGRIRTATLKDGTIVLCLSDIAKALGYKSPADAVSTHCKKGVCVLPTPTVNQHGATVMQSMKYGVEGCMNKLIMKSHLPDAEEFQDWVCYDVLPSIRKTGSYSLQPQLPNFNNPAESARAWADQYEKNQMLSLEVKKKEEEKQAIIEETKPAVIFKDCVTGSATNILVGDLAKLITQNGYNIGEIRLYDWMVENKYLIRKQRYSKSKDKYINDYMPTQRAAEMGLFFVKERPILSGDSPIFIKHTCYVTGKGQVYFLNKFKALIGA